MTALLSVFVSAADIHASSYRENAEQYVFRYSKGAILISTPHTSYRVHDYTWDGGQLVANDTVRQLTMVLRKDTIVEFVGVGCLYLGHLIVVQRPSETHKSVVAHVYQLPSLQLHRVVHGDEFVRHGHVIITDTAAHRRRVVDVVTGDTFALGDTEYYRFYRWIMSSLTGCLRDLYRQEDIECGHNRIVHDQRGYAVIVGFGGSDKTNVEPQKAESQGRVYVLDPIKLEHVHVGAYIPPYDERSALVRRQDSAFYVSELRPQQYCCLADVLRQQTTYTTMTGYVFTDISPDIVSLLSPEGDEIFRYTRKYERKWGARVSYAPREIFTETWLLYRGDNRADVLFRQQDGTFMLWEDE